VFVTIMTLALVTMTPGNPGMASGWPAMLGGSAPDTYGYYWLDSDTVAPGAPTYNWIDIKSVGTRITTLGDDNVAGPFEIGFDFPYYWYLVNRVYVGSNGYIAFNDNALAASPFATVPGAPRPNNTLAAMMSDLDCSAGGSPSGSVWYWTNAAMDTFIVQYDSCRFWNVASSNNTFEIILSRPDSTITYQYLEQTGAPSSGWTADANQCGIENVSGGIGRNYLSGDLPSGNMYHAGLAVKFIPPATTTLQVHDCGMAYAMNEWSGGFFSITNRPITFWAKVGNFGNQSEGAYKTYFVFKRTSGSVLTPASIPGQMDSIVSPTTYTPTTNGTFVVVIYTRLVGDMVPTNDSVKIELHTVQLPATLTYDSEIPTNTMYWNGPGGFGNRFIPPVYPCSVSAVRIYLGLQAAASVDVFVGLFDDNGPGDGPGDTLYGAMVTDSIEDWYTVTLPTPVVVSDGNFFVGGMSEVVSEPTFGMDSIPPLSYQGWEYTGVWAPGRDASVRDVMANALILSTTGISEWTGPGAGYAPLRLRVSPNPASGLATLKLVNARGTEKALDVYDATGSVVRTLALDGSKAVLDGSTLAEGIYFCRVAGSRSPVAKLIIAR
jgi:hypothetical protein